MAIPDEIPQGSKEYLEVVLESDDDLTLGTVALGLSSTPSTQPDTWLPGEWPNPGINRAQTTAEVDTTAMPKGFYQVWARLTDSPEVIPRPYGTVRIV